MHKIDSSRFYFDSLEQWQKFLEYCQFIGIYSGHSDEGGKVIPEVYSSQKGVFYTNRFSPEFGTAFDEFIKIYANDK